MTKKKSGSGFQMGTLLALVIMCVVLSVANSLSILYMQLHDRTDDPDALQLATRCYREAFETNADSARMYYEHLPVDQDKYAMTLATIVSTLDNPPAPLEDDDPYVSPDSIGMINN